MIGQPSYFLRKDHGGSNEVMTREKPDLIFRSRETAAAFLEDVAYMREVVARDDTRLGDIRRMSGILRRLLIDRDLVKVASPRIGRMTLTAPDNEAIYRTSWTQPILFFMSGRVRVFGWDGTVLAFEPRKGYMPANPFPSDFHVDWVQQLSIEDFLAQTVICFRNSWVSRFAIIRYVANKASGVHSDTQREGNDALISLIRRANTITLRDGGIHVDLMRAGLDSDADIPFKYDPAAIDPALVEILSTAAFLVRSPDVIRLEEVVTRELS